MDKTQIRKNVCYLRESHQIDEFKLKSDLICKKIMSLDFFSDENCKGKKISLYYTHRMEVDLTLLREFFLLHEAKCFYPITCSQEIIFGKYDPQSTEKDQCKTGAMGIREPFAGVEELIAMNFVLIPGIAFDKKGNRIGYGKGYYDKYLSSYIKNSNKMPLIIAPAFEFQIIDNIPCQSHDIPVDIIVTEERVIFTKFHCV